MTESEIIRCAQDFLDVKRIGYVPDATIGRVEENRSEIVFPVPEALDPNVVVDPEDVRVWVGHDTAEVELIVQM